MAYVNVTSSWTTAVLHSFSQNTDFLMKVIMKCVNIKFWDILGCFHYILNAPRIINKMSTHKYFFCGFPGYKPVPPGWFKIVCWFYAGNTQGLTECGFMEKPGIEPATPG